MRRPDCRQQRYRSHGIHDRPDKKIKLMLIYP
jgi:hypothetical protein